MAGVGVLGSACTSILGDFSSGPGAGPDASTEGGLSDSDAPEAMSPGDSAVEPQDSGASDATRDASADSGLLACTTWKWTQPLVVESLESATSRRFTGNVVSAFPTKSATLRIVAGKSDATLFSVYTVDTTTQAVTQLDVPGATNDTVLGIWRDRGAGANLTAVVDRVTVPMESPTFNVRVLPDSMGNSGPVPTAFPVYAPTPTQTVTSMTVAPQSLSNVFEAVATSVGGTSYTLGVGDVTTTFDPTSLGTVATALTSAPFNGPHLYQVASGNIYIFNENDPSTPGFTSWAVPLTGAIDGGVTPLLVESGKLSGVVDVAPNTSQPSADFVTYEIIKAGNLVETYNLRVGIVPNASLGSWSATSLPLVGNSDAGTYQRVQNAPVFSGNQVFWGDDIMLLGQGYCIAQPDAGCVTSAGLNAVWLNASTGLRSQQTGNNRLLTSSAGNFFDAFSVPQSIGASTASWYIVWGEHQQDEGGTYDVLYMNILQCE